MRIKELDGLRGIAVLAVMNTHYLGWAPITGSAYGWLGVDLFFVLSGFLITSILLGLREKENRFKIFYSRRALRIFPPYFLGISVYFAVSVALGLPGTLKLWLQYIFYYVSLYVHDPLPPHGAPSGVPWVISFGLTVLWSLSVEEIYYTIWAPVVSFTTETGFLILLTGMIVTAPFLRWFLRTPTGNEVFVFYCRMDALAYGSAVALLIRKRRLSPDRWLRIDEFVDRAAIVWVPLSTIFWLITGGNRSNLLVSTVGLVLADVSFALITHALVRRAGGKQLWVRIFRTRWLCSIGIVSYSLYLFHYPLLIVSTDIVAKIGLSRRLSAISEVLLGMVMSFAVAYGLWYGMESRILRWKEKKVPSPVHP